MNFRNFFVKALHLFKKIPCIFCNFFFLKIFVFIEMFLHYFFVLIEQIEAKFRENFRIFCERTKCKKCEIFAELFFLLTANPSLGVCLYPIIVKTAEPISNPIFVQDFKCLPEILKIHKIFIKSAKFFICFCFTMYIKRKCLQLKSKMAAKRPKILKISLDF